MLAILDYDAGNIESVRLALRRVGGDPVFARDADAAAGATRIVFPGVGSAAQCMRNFRERGFDGLLAGALERNVPILAICIGMQLLFDFSEEDGGVACLGLMPGRVRRFRPKNPRDKVPHMGWNHVDMPRAHPLLPPDAAGGDFYFVHSYYVEPAWDDPAVAHGEPAPGGPACQAYGTTGYADIVFASMAGRGSLFACQFHPEKSGETGLAVLRRFLAWDGRPC